MSQSKLSFDGTPMELTGSMRHVPSSMCKLPLCKADPVTESNNIAVINLTTCEMNIVKILKNRQKYLCYWHKVGSNDENGLNHAIYVKT